MRAPWYLVLLLWACATDEPGSPKGHQPGALPQGTPAPGPALLPSAPSALPQTRSLPPAQDPPPSPELYMGRRIARTMHWAGATWLMRPEREEEENTSLLLEALGVEAGDVICDLGCGNGYITLPLAEAVGPGGRVWAVDIQPEMIAMLRERATEAELTNLIPVVCNILDPGLEPDSLDLIVCVDVYHELSHPAQVLAHLRRALKPTGLLALVEFRAEDPEVRILRDHKMSRAQMKLELLANGFALERSFDELPWQHLMFFRRDDAPPADPHQEHR